MYWGRNYLENLIALTRSINSPSTFHPEMCVCVWGPESWSNGILPMGFGQLTGLTVWVKLVQWLGFTWLNWPAAAKASGFIWYAKYSASVDISTTPTTSNLLPRRSWSQMAWKTMRPMRPNPLMPTLVAMTKQIQRSWVGKLKLRSRWAKMLQHSTSLSKERMRRKRVQHDP